MHQATAQDLYQPLIKSTRISRNGHMASGFERLSMGSSHLLCSPPLVGWDGKPQPSIKGWQTCSPGNNKSHTRLSSIGWGASSPLQQSGHPSCASEVQDHLSADPYEMLTLPSQHLREVSHKTNCTVFHSHPLSLLHFSSFIFVTLFICILYTHTVYY